ncbi:Uncharacterized protein, possibly involved in utilization of glycolate and propanediol OS=Singulisphaera acidiphila (strain ATCC BAA-1392 / DSM 18658 / VKM B-2454 / MOB10) GN=Sinac_0910 PE=4 SV=1: DUF336 [Gemmataceae bacterium]|nr:Uncharacterized protein, possibly involved in utilization of glycolate and propanediol OS=Singulisphaera acidiphila (strain ATCC BAA-1392 / DSM 18658 / VKM B-2454 / MOB10) GN=Sinac_0910 PE=4 SV=1: DUF336 [Gemmataceae bacterium]VTU01251.1 Uncharacterized protein, possibly involved in utilization of glycolate and propanediol OS=Singulisphaera acidiphila (strain ATCC BAA-1392 / DSM 18658 / VKM B-2454 / MOB10) GN=Sinac_0910 PE=4 SV=1: DUF336 [Gemmataceae bacterium]
MSTPNRRTLLNCEPLEDRSVPSAAALSAGTLTVTGDPGDNRIRVLPEGGNIIVLDGAARLGAFPSAAVTRVVVHGGDGKDSITVSGLVARPVTLAGGAGDDRLSAGGGPATLLGGPGTDALVGGVARVAFNGGPGADDLYKVKATDTVAADPADRILSGTRPVPPAAAAAAQQTLTAAEVGALLRRAAAASASSDAIIVVTDRNGRILGVRVESGVSPAVTGSPRQLVFAIDGAVSLARTGAFFGNNQAPLTSRTVQFISQSTITQREVESNPSIPNPHSTVRGPGFVAPVGTRAHFPPNVPNTPMVDLFQIEHTNRLGTYAPGPDRVIGTADDVRLAERFHINPAFVPPGQGLFEPDSYGVESGVSPRTANGVPIAVGRGIATLPGGVPIFKNGQAVGGIGVFFPGNTGYATESNSSLSALYDPSRPDRTLEAEWIAFAAVGGATTSIGGVATLPVGALGGVPVPAGFGLPSGRIDLVGVTLDIFGPGGNAGLGVLARVGASVGRGSPDDGTNQLLVAGTPIRLRGGVRVPEGWIVAPHDGAGVTAADVVRTVVQGINQANLTRAAIRLPLGSRTKMVFAVADLNGNIVGLYRQPDATVFSLDVAVAKARNVAYYANAGRLQAADRLPGVPAGTAFESRTFRFLSGPRYPEGIGGTAPGPFSQLNDGGASLLNGVQVGPRLPASAYRSVVGYDAFNPGTNFHSPFAPLNQSGVVFFPGGAPLYRGYALIGGFGASGDGVDQDEVMTIAAQAGYDVPLGLLRADDVFFRGVRLPYQKTNRNPQG